MTWRLLPRLGAIQPTRLLPIQRLRLISQLSRQLNVIDCAREIEEEILSDYVAERYYPVHLGQVFNSRYRVVTKLGFGATATIWLCWDIQEERHLTLKLHVRTNHPIREVQILKYLKSIQQRQTHGGGKYIRVALDSFDVQGPHGVHPCLVYEPAGMDMSGLLDVFDGALPVPVHRTAIRSVLVALDYLHRFGVVHTDVQPNNILLGIDTPSVLEELENAESSNPTPRKHLANRTIHTFRSMPVTTGEPVLSDLGEARLSQNAQKQNGLIMPGAYRAPEVLLDMDWDDKVDIWAVGQTAWSLFEKGHLFPNTPLDTDLDHAHRFAGMISLLGPPPPEFLSRSEESLKFWDENGNWKGAVPVPEGSLEDRECRLGGRDRVVFLEFIRKALCWVPEERASAWDLLWDGWIRGGDC